jgi:predicted PurR-regulated permease PerM
MTGKDQSLVRPLVGAACIVIVAWGIRAASHVLLLILISLFLAYAAVPFPRWLMKRFKLGTSAALALTAILVVVIYVVFSSLLFTAGLRMMAKLPAYEAHFTVLYEQISSFLIARGAHLPTAPTEGYLSAGRVADVVIQNLTNVTELITNRLLVWVLSVLFLVQIVEQDESKRGPFASSLIDYGGEVERFIGIQAKTGAITALANFALLLVLGVDFPGLWCVLYFFLQFIPSLGFIIALVPPTLVALLIFGWKRALLVAGGLVFTQMLADYVILPMFMKKGLDFALLDIMLSLIVWGFLLGPWGGILAVPLTLVLRKYIQGFSKEAAPARATPV